MCFSVFCEQAWSPSQRQRSPWLHMFCSDLKCQECSVPSENWKEESAQINEIVDSFGVPLALEI